MSGWLKNPERRRTAFSFAVLLGLLLLFYYRLWWPGLVLVKRDAFRFFAPIRQYVAERLLAGELPEWFPFESLGRSLIGSTAAGVFHPFTVLFMAFPAHDALRFSTLAACLLGGAGALILGRTYQLSRAASVIAGLAFACSGYVVSMTEHITYFYAICALPLFCSGLAKAVKGTLVWVIGPAVLWATVFLNGDIQTGYYYGFIALLQVLSSSDVSTRTALGRLALVTVLTALLSGIQLAPSFAALQASERADPALFHKDGLLWSTHPLQLLTVVASPVGDATNHFDIAHFFFGSLPAGHAFIGTWADSLYVGLPAVGLALMGAWARRDLRWIALLGCLALWLALGKYGWLYGAFFDVVPLWSVFRYPEKLMGVVTFSVAMLAGAGVDTIRERRAPAVLWAMAVVLCLCLWSICQTDAVGWWVAEYFRAPIPLAQETTRSLAYAFLFSGAATLGVTLVILAFRFSRLPEPLLLGILTVVILLDLSRVNQEAYRTGPADLATFTPTLVQVIEQHAGVRGAGHFRISSDPGGYIDSPVPVLQALGVYGISALNLKQTLHVELNAPFGIESINDYMSGQSVDMASLGSLRSRHFDIWASIYARFNVAYLIGQKDQFSSPPLSQYVIGVLPSHDIALVKNPARAKARVYLSRQPQAVNSHVSVERLAASQEFLLGAVDLIETRGEPLPGPNEKGRASMERYDPGKILVRTETPAPAVLILLDAYEAGWRASLEDGQELPIWRANALVRAVAVPAGTHQVTFTYRTPLLAAGAWCSFAGMLICLGLWWSAWRTGRQGRMVREPHEMPSR